MKAQLVVQVDPCAPVSPGFAALVRALAEFVDLRSEGAGPVLRWDGEFARRADGSLVEFPSQPQWLDHLLPMPPFLRARARAIRHLPSPLVVGADEPSELVEVASIVTAPATTSSHDFVRAMALGSVVRAAPPVMDRHLVRVGEHVLSADSPVDDATMAAVSRRAARWARQHHDPRRAARLLVEALGLHRRTPPMAGRHACAEMHGGWLGRVDARVARSVGGPWA